MLNDASSIINSQFIFLIRLSVYREMIQRALNKTTFVTHNPFSSLETYLFIITLHSFLPQRGNMYLTTYKRSIEWPRRGQTKHIRL